jgi:hypothetical protein
MQTFTLTMEFVARHNLTAESVERVRRTINTYAENLAADISASASLCGTVSVEDWQIESFPSWETRDADIRAKIAQENAIEGTMK